MSYMDNWVKVFSLFRGDYDWGEFRAYYDPEDKQFYWDQQSGCSCFGWETPETKSGWMSGDRAYLEMHALNLGFEDDDYYGSYTLDDKDRMMKAIKKFPA